MDGLSEIETPTPGASGAASPQRTVMLSPVTVDETLETVPYGPIRRTRRPRLMIRMSQEFEPQSFLWHVCRSQEEVNDLLLWEKSVNFSDLAEPVSH